MKKRTSLKDIATRVGVSTALVSYVLNNQKEDRISKEVAARIKAVAKELNYRTNQIAKGLKTSKTFTIGLIVADISNSFSASLARIIEDEADKNGYTVLFGSSDENDIKLRKLAHEMINRGVDGLILAPTENAIELLLELKETEVPFVLLDRYFPQFRSSYVALDNFQAGYMATEHAIESGGKRIGMINFRSTHFHLEERTRGWLSALREHKIPGGKKQLRLVREHHLESEVQKTVNSLLSQQEPVDTLLLASNMIAIHALRYIIEKRLKVPKDIAIIVIDETEAFEFFYAPLTFIRQPLQEMGQTATRILLDNISHNKAVSQVNLSPELVVKKSSLHHYSSPLKR
ncbi:transcriptional regulator, LacI family [Chitinophaga ginsengisegetis]|uniref:Transcriptional regulator, LacI family n=1 Tax=Chitinophaga ginsengisegetis TaxID=393003 RepID=A0A1T5N5H2_9BACT|nr:LacI family DNA-binding transcriptional regulator [Chitinophaga ginsengisegetis]SKC95696.1 transcriptional regulator, LacI family [Chitinophaga ginsengisegetis]